MPQPRLHPLARSTNPLRPPDSSVFGPSLCLLSLADVSEFDAWIKEKGARRWTNSPGRSRSWGGHLSVVHHLNQEPWSPSRQGSYTTASKQPLKCNTIVQGSDACVCLCYVGSAMPCCCEGLMYCGVLLVKGIKQTGNTISVDSSVCYLLPSPSSLLLPSLLLPLQSSTSR